MILMSENKTYEMLWDCQVCGTKKNLGLTHRFCPNCGSPQNPDSRYYPSDEEKIEVKDHQYVGADVTCPVCGTLNSAAAEFCGNCGSPLTEGARAKTLEQESRAAGEVFQSGGSRDLVKEEFDAEMQRIGVQDAPGGKKGGINWKMFGIIGAVIAAIIGGITAFNYTEEATVIVTGREWERSISIEEYQNFSVRDWRDSRPAGDNVSRNSCTREVRSYNQVADGQDCRTVRRDNGDGTFSESQECTTRYRDESVYDDMCTWSGQRWESEQTVRATGDLGDTPSWPNISLNCDGQRRVGCEQESGRGEEYLVLFGNTENDSNYKCPFSQTEWDNIQVESLWTAEIRVLTGGLIVCESLARK
jgi:hypothetical protein